MKVIDIYTNGTIPNIKYIYGQLQETSFRYRSIATFRNKNGLLNKLNLIIMKKAITIVGVLAASIIFAYAQSNESRPLEDFTGINVSQSIDVKLHKGNENIAVIQTHGINTETVKTSIEKGILYIKMKKGTYFSKKVEIDLTYKELQTISVSASASIRCDDEIATRDFDLQVSSSGYTSLVLNVRNLDIKISSSGTATLTGKAKYQKIKISSSGKLSAFDMDSEEVEAQTSSSGKAKITVHSTLHGKASSSGKIYYRGNPSNIYVDTSSSGKIIAGG